MGFSFHITTIHAGAELRMHYKNHLECVYCISGAGSIEDVAGGRRHPIRAGVMYALDRYDLHILRADPGVEMVMACVFNPPLTGREVHGADGAYPAEQDQLDIDAARARHCDAAPRATNATDKGPTK